MPGKPFSGKQKKKQLQERREKKKGAQGVYDDDDVQEVGQTTSGDGDQGQAEILHVHQQPTSSKDFDPNRYRLHFLKVSPEEMKKRKAAARKPVIKVAEKDLEMSVESIHVKEPSLDFPKRPPWEFTLSKQQLEKQERSYFQDYVHSILTSHDAERLSYFELNLETWRQLWRVIEISDILLLIADIRHPVLHLPPSLYKYLREELRREVVIVLNKVDLVPPGLTAAWRAYLNSVFSEAHIVCFASVPAVSEETGTGFHHKQKKRSVKPLGPQELLDMCKEFVKEKVNLESWQHKMDTQDISTSAPDKHDHEESVAPGNQPNRQSQIGAADIGYGVYQRFRDGILTIGCIGYPNVGKSSLLNGLVGKKVVSVSKTPGHTKHLQTIFLTPTVKLCDCPGLVFPSYVDKSLQILSGIFPIAQVREPYSAVGYLAQWLDLPRVLHLPHPDIVAKKHVPQDNKDLVWSAYDMCEGWAMKYGYFTAKAARPDVYRAANHILRLAVEGRLRLCYAPPGYFDQKETWKTDPFATSLAERLEKQAKFGSSAALQEDSVSESDSDGNQDAASSGSGSDGDSESENGRDEGGRRHKHTVDRNPFALLSDH
ncbi:guanine nucleotide-binding protein-like 1 [Littorina saxatilis]|uniref:Guanine nucleotide-binding protein-like 1 n=1 Tax=Littorina saxatilis TaxID=31220 RepID=A0AAN9AXV5_9CAEN